MSHPHSIHGICWCGAVEHNSGHYQQGKKDVGGHVTAPTVFLRSQSHHDIAQPCLCHHPHCHMHASRYLEWYVISPILHYVVLFYRTFVGMQYALFDTYGETVQ